MISMFIDQWSLLKKKKEKREKERRRREEEKRRSRKSRDSCGSTKRARTSMTRCSRARPALIEKALSLRSLFSSPSSRSRDGSPSYNTGFLCCRHTHCLRARIRFILFCSRVYLDRSLLRRHIFFPPLCVYVCMYVIKTRFMVQGHLMKRKKRRLMKGMFQ